MTMKPAEERLYLGPRQRHGRAINSVADFLRKSPKLSVPNIYINPHMPLLTEIDILAVDRAGSGDLHAIEVKELLNLPSSVPFNRYLDEVKSGLPTSNTLQFQILQILNDLSLRLSCSLKMESDV
jgi:hypothetical protein